MITQKKLIKYPHYLWIWKYDIVRKTNTDNSYREEKEVLKDFKNS